MSSPHDAFGPPLPPKPISDGDNSRTATPAPSSQSQPYPPPPGGGGGGAQIAQLTPPSPDSLFIPSLLSTKSVDDLQFLAHSPDLLSALFTATHPLSTQSTTLLTSALTQNIHLASRVQSLDHSLNQLRSDTERRLLEAKSLERSWRDKEKEMYVALQPFSPPALYNRLMSAVGEAESLSEALEASFLEERGESGGGGRDVGEFIREYRTMRKVYHLRRERKERWDEGRIGGWR
ncbi:hypothetical protein DFH27DRAFT_610981 [Peziza echinospora]|nr:hypothetical protein DFH27DRAFT_610981 [Peziza echinospora]